MATDTLEATLIPDTTIDLQDEAPVSTSQDERVDATLVAIAPQLRCEVREELRRDCSYEVQEVVDGEPVVVNQGETVALNRSEDGVLLVMNRAPHRKQMIEVHTRRAFWGRTAHIYEARWTKPVHMESFGDVYLVGCRRVVGPCHYVSF